MLPTPCVILSGNLPTMADSCLASSTAEVREPYCLVWQCYGTWASRNHQELITCAWLPSASPWLPIPARESSPGHQEQREESNWILRSCLLWLSKKPFIFGHPTVGKKQPAAEGICLSVSLKEIWVSTLIIGTKFPRRQSVTIKTYGMCFDSFIFVFQK